MIDFRSDTVTKPSKEMMEAMFSAEVGDDVFVEDPTVNELEAYTAELFGMEAAIYCSSGTQTNQVAINEVKSLPTWIAISINMKVAELRKIRGLRFD